jgi:hypothetical protein
MTHAVMKLGRFPMNDHSFCVGALHTCNYIVHPCTISRQNDDSPIGQIAAQADARDRRCVRQRNSGFAIFLVATKQRR